MEEYHEYHEDHEDHEEQMVPIMVGEQKDEGSHIFSIGEIKQILAMHKSLTEDRQWAPSGASIVCSLKTKIPVKYIRILIAEYLVHDKVEMSSIINHRPFKIVADFDQDQFPGFQSQGKYLTHLFSEQDISPRFDGTRNGWQNGYQIDAAVERLCEQDYARYLNTFGNVSLIGFFK